MCDNLIISSAARSTAMPRVNPSVIATMQLLAQQLEADGYKAFIPEMEEATA